MSSFLKKFFTKKEETPPMDTPIDIFPERTPNPRTMKFLTSASLLTEGTLNLTSAKEAALSPLALRLFNLPFVQEVFFGPNFLTVTKSDSVEWSFIEETLIQEIRAHLLSGAPIVNEASLQKESSSCSTMEAGIREVLDREIRPAVQMDGGDITFVAYKDGIVELLLQGSCSGCPSSTMTLRMGIEYRLKELFPEIQAVVAAAPEL